MTPLKLFLFIGTELRSNTPTARPSTGIDLKDALINLAASTQFEHLPDADAGGAAAIYIGEQLGNPEWGVEVFLSKGLTITPSGSARYKYTTVNEAATATVFPGHVYYFEERESVFIKSRAVARHSESHGWTNLVEPNDNPLHICVLNAYYFDDRRGGPPGEEVAHKLSFLLNPKPAGTSRTLPLREAMRIAAEAADGQLEGYYDDETGEPVVDHSDPCCDHHAIFVIETVRHTHYSHGDREYNLTALSAAFRRAGAEFAVYAEAFEAEPTADDTEEAKTS
jgi:hypothetical protein